MWLITLFSAAASLVNAIELIFKAFPGAGQVKKRTVMSALSELLDAARKAGLSLDGDELLAKLSQYVDAYVIMQHAAGLFHHAAVVAEPGGQVRLDDRGILEPS